MTGKKIPIKRKNHKKWIVETYVHIGKSIISGMTAYHFIKKNVEKFEDRVEAQNELERRKESIEQREKNTIGFQKEKTEVES